jgi:molybdopterin molybdotransferase
LAPSEEIDLSRALGRVCGEDIYAKLSHPPAAVSAMDGYACRSKDVTRLPARLRKIGISRAGERFQGDVAASTCVRIFTGGIVPEGADVIALQEDAIEIGGEVEIREVPAVGKHIRRAGLDFAAGEVCLTKGRALTARDIGLLAACGHARIPMRRRPIVAILSTGDELVAPGDAPGADQIVGSNGAGLAAAVTAWGATPVDLGIVPDSIETIAAAVEQAKDADMLVTTGGASVGDHDLVQAGLARRGFVSDFWRIAMRPGKPLLFGRLGELPILGLPGNPVSALVCALIFLRPALRKMLDIRPAVPNFETAILGAGMAKNDQREDYVRARLELNGGRATAFPFPAQDSSMLMTLAKANALIRRRPFAPPALEGAEIEIIRLDSPEGCF